MADEEGGAPSCCYLGEDGDGGGGRSASSGSCVLIAMDESEESFHALSWAIATLLLPPAADDTIVVLLHVQNRPQVLLGPIGAGFYITPEILESIRRAEDHVSRKILLRAKLLCDEKNIRTETMVAIGDAREGICQAVERLRPRYLVIGSHGYGAFKRTFLGSVSNHCAHHAKCPVVIVRKQAAVEVKS